jgi:NitT/TauT family transport system permease protein
MFNRGDKRKRRDYVASILFGLEFLFIAWLILSFSGIINPIFLADPISTFKNIFFLFSAGSIDKDILLSLYRVIVGFALALITGIPIGIVCGISKNLGAFIESNMSFLRYIPIAAFIPLTILWFGVSEAEKIFLIFLSVISYMVLYVGATANSVEKEYIEVAKTLGLNKFQIVARIVVPRSLPNIWHICRIEMSGAWAAVILAEVIASNSGLGYRLVLAQRFLHTTDIFSLIIIIGFVGLVIDIFFKISYKLLFPWAEKTNLYGL